MKLFVWHNPYDVNWGMSLLFVVAENEEQALILATEKGKAYEHGYEQPRNSNSARNLGKPNRVVDLPCAEWHEWSE